MRICLLCFLVSPLLAGTAAPFTLDFSQAGGGIVAGSTVASGLNFPYGMAVTGNGSVLFGQSVPNTQFGIEGGSVSGSVWILPKQADGSFGAPQKVIDGLGGVVTDVRVAADGTILVDSGAASGRSLTLFNASYQQVANLGFSYPTQAWWHSTGMSLVTPEAGGERVYFIVGSENDQQATTDKVTTNGLFSATLNADSVYMVDVLNSGGTLSAGTPVQVATGLRTPTGWR